MIHKRLISLPLMLIACCTVLSLQATKAHGRETVFVHPPEVFSEDDAALKQIHAMQRNAIHLANKRFGEYVEFILDTNTGVQSNYNAVITIFDDSLTLTIEDEKGRETDSGVILGQISPHTALHLSDLLFYQWSFFHNHLKGERETPPILVDEIPTSVMSRSVLPDMHASLVPTSIATKPNGNFLVGLSMLCVELNGSFGIVGQPGRALYESGDYTFASSVATTPGGTIYFKPSMGRTLFQINPGMEKPQMLRSGMDVLGPCIALQDGSVVLIDIQKKQSIRIRDGKKQKLNLQSGPYSYITAADAGPENTIWVYDAFERRVRVYSPEGDLINSIMPLIHPSSGTNVLAMAVYDDGSFVLHYSEGLLCSFTGQGIPRWELDTMGTGMEEPLPQIVQIDVVHQEGIIYLADQMGGRIVKLLDLSHRANQGSAVHTHTEIAALTKEQAQHPDDWSPTARKAEYYEKQGALEMSKHLWELILEYDPDNDEAMGNAEELELKLLKSQALRQRNKTVVTLQTLGPESARQSYRSTLQLYERILSMRPDERETREQRNSLQTLFRQHEQGKTGSVPRFLDVKIEIDNLFPSLMQYYRNHPAGFVAVKNTTKHVISDVKATVSIAKYMDYPVETDTVRTLNPGEEARLDVHVLLNEQIFTVQENLPIQVRVEISYTMADRITQSQTEDVLLYRRTAISWDDSSKLSAFITPHEGIVTEFSHKVAALSEETERFKLTDAFLRASRICDALGSVEIEYIEDPDSPISDILGNADIIDTVRFARTTLLIRSGDCDDTVVLLSSVLESSGINTAIMTSPGHVFLAFDSGEPARSGWMFETARLKTITHGGTVWIPVETTILQRGFMHAWEAASDLISRFTQEGEIEFIPLSIARQHFPPLPLPVSSFSVVEPPGSDIDRAHSLTLDSFITDLYGDIEEKLMVKRAASDHKTSRAAYNRIGILHARYGRFDEAESAFNEVIVRYPDYIAPYVNLAQLRLATGDVEDALTTILRALQREPESPQVHLLLARCYSRMGDHGLSESHFKKVQLLSPSLAKAYGHVLEGGNSTGRAGKGHALEFWWTPEDM